MVYLPTGSSDLFLILDSMASNFLYLDFSTLYSSSLSLVFICRENPRRSGILVLPDCPRVYCSRLRDSRVRWIEKARTFRVPFSFASSSLSESLEQALWKTDIIDLNLLSKMCPPLKEAPPRPYWDPNSNVFEINTVNRVQRVILLLISLSVVLE